MSSSSSSSPPSSPSSAGKRCAPFRPASERLRARRDIAGPPVCSRLMMSMCSAQLAILATTQAHKHNSNKATKSESGANKKAATGARRSKALFVSNLIGLKSERGAFAERHLQRLRLRPHRLDAKCRFTGTCGQSAVRYGAQLWAQQVAKPAIFSRSTLQIREREKACRDKLAGDLTQESERAKPLKYSINILMNEQNVVSPLLSKMLFQLRA